MRKFCFSILAIDKVAQNRITISIKFSSFNSCELGNVYVVEMQLNGTTLAEVLGACKSATVVTSAA